MSIYTLYMYTCAFRIHARTIKYTYSCMYMYMYMYIHEYGHSVSYSCVCDVDREWVNGVGFFLFFLNFPVWLVCYAHVFHVHVYSVTTWYTHMYMHRYKYAAHSAPYSELPATSSDNASPTCQVTYQRLEEEISGCYVGLVVIGKHALHVHVCINVVCVQFTMCPYR